MSVMAFYVLDLVTSK